MTPGDEIVPASFRDPSGFLFRREGTLYRQVNAVYKESYQLLMSSGLYDRLTAGALMVPHEEVDIPPPSPHLSYKIIKPKMVHFVSYPYEWSFSQLKDAALATLKIQRIAMEYGMALKDASAYNIQFEDGKPVLIDSLSFEPYREGKPWVAYRQFCQHFLAPLALMAYKDVRLSQLLRIYIDGLPLDLASSLLPWWTWLNLSLLSHVHLHARSEQHYADKPVDISRYSMGRLAMIGLIDGLKEAISRLRWCPAGTEWSEYYKDTNYTPAAFEHKKQIVAGFIDRVRPQTVWDLGANVGIFSRLAAEKGAHTIAWDIDPAAVEINYLDCRSRGETKILPLVLDLSNPSPSLGWENRERMSLVERGPADCVLALALLHHLAISNNVPFSRIAEFFSRVSRWLIIEFVPKEDSQVERMLLTRREVFQSYSEADFEAEFGRYFRIEGVEKIRDSRRKLYLMHKHG